MSGKTSQSFYEKIALFPLFTITSAYLATLFWGDFMPAWITSHWVLYSGLGLIILSIVFGFIVKLYFLSVFDIFLTGCLFVWVVYWQKEYTFQAPVFRAFSLYFVLVNLLLARFAKNDVFDEDQYQLLNFLTKRIVFKPMFYTILVLFGLYLQEWYMLFPLFTSMLMISALLVLWTEKINFTGH